MRYALWQLYAVNHINRELLMSADTYATHVAPAVSATTPGPQLGATACNEAFCHGTICSDGARAQPQNSVQDG